MVRGFVWEKVCFYIAMFQTSRFAVLRTLFITSTHKVPGLEFKGGVGHMIRCCKGPVGLIYLKISTIFTAKCNSHAYV